MEIQILTNSHAVVISVTGGNGDSRTAAALPLILEADSSPVRQQAVALHEAAIFFANEATKIIATYSPNVRVGQLRSLAARVLAKAVQSLMEGGVAEARAIVAAWARLTAVPMADATATTLRQSDRAAFATLAMGDKAAWINKGNVDQLEAIVEGGRDRATVTPEIWEHAQQRYAALNFIRMAGTAADHARKPSLEEPLAIGIDMDAAERAANEALKRHHERTEVIQAVEQAIQGIAGVVAMTGELDVNASFDLLITGKVNA